MKQLRLAAIALTILTTLAFTTSTATAATHVPFSVSTARVVAVSAGKLVVEPMTGASGTGIARSYVRGTVTFEIAPPKSLHVGDYISYSGWAEDHSYTVFVPVVTCSGKPARCVTIMYPMEKTHIVYSVTEITPLGHLRCAAPSTAINVDIPFGFDYSVRVGICRTATELSSQRIFAGRLPTSQVRDVKLAITFADGKVSVVVPSGAWNEVVIPAGSTSRAISKMTLTFDVIDDGKPAATYTVGQLNSDLPKL